MNPNPIHDPAYLTSAHWWDIHLWLTWFWIYLPIVIVFAFTLLTAHAIIPSLIETHHLPERFNRLRGPMTGFALIVLVAAILVLAVVISITVGFVDDIYHRWLY